MWGWTASKRISQNRIIIVPTHVGVNREGKVFRGIIDNCPHACGGEPVQLVISDHMVILSPRMWGWTEVAETCKEIYLIVPTHVGVNRRHRIWFWCSYNCPHACGGEPLFQFIPIKYKKLSPRMWGWTDHKIHIGVPHQIVPTHVGVNRYHLRWKYYSWNCPHACGGEPK